MTKNIQDKKGKDRAQNKVKTLKEKDEIEAGEQRMNESKDQEHTPQERKRQGVEQGKDIKGKRQKQKEE